MKSDSMSGGVAPLVTAPVSRRGFLTTAGALGALVALDRLTPAYAQTPTVRPLAGSLAGLGGDASLGALRGDAGAIDLAISRTAVEINDRRATATAINGTVPGPLLRFREGEDVTIHVTNHLGEDTSVHWHGIIVPNAMDGVPGVNYAGIRAGETFTYRLPIRQYGTYWYHSHSAFQEQTGHYGPIIIDPAEPAPYAYDREYVVMLSDWTFEDPYKILDHVKKQSDYYNYQRRTVGDFFKDVGRMGLRATVQDRLAWGRMRMSPVDISDVTGATYTYLVNGRSPASNWTGLFRPGERVLLRVINGGAGTHFDFRVPGLELTVVAVDGQYVKPVVTDEFRLGNAETYDVIVQPREDRAYTVYAESADRSGYTRGTLAPRAGMSAPVPPRRPRPVLTMADMGMMMDMGGTKGQAMDMPGMNMNGLDMKGHEQKGMQMPSDTSGTRAAGTAGMAGMAGMQMPAATGQLKSGAAKSSPDAGRTKAAADTSMSGMSGHDMSGHDMSGMSGRGGMPASGKPAKSSADSAGRGAPMPNMAGHDMSGMAGMSGNGGSGTMSGMQHNAQPQGAQHASAAGGGMAGMAGMSGMGDMGEPAAPVDRVLPDGSRERTKNLRPPGTIPAPTMGGPNVYGPGNAATPMTTRSRLSDPGPGLGNDGWRVLVYSDLRALTPYPDATRPPTREIEIHLTGNMERYMWSINGIKFSDVPGPIQLEHNERIRLTMVNDTMMSHPMHLHGMWMELENGHGAEIPRLHTINVKPAERLSVLVTADALGPWAFHCHILYHMETGMMRVVHVGPPGGTPTVAAQGGA